MSTAVTSTPSPGPAPAAAPTPKLTFIPDILEEHLAELAFLYGQRSDAWRSPEYSYATLLELEERMAAHLHGVLVVGERGLDTIEAGLASDDALDVFASAFSLLQMGDPALETRVLVLFARAEGAQLDGLRLALRHGASAGTTSRLALLMKGAPSPAAAAAADVLAFRGLHDIELHRLRDFLAAKAPRVRGAGWRLVAYVMPALEPAAYETALRDDDAGVKREAFLAAAWCGQPLVLAAAREAARTPAGEHLHALHILAVLATAQDAAVLHGIARSGLLGPDGLRLLGSLGSPATIGTVLREMENTDPAIAAAAGAAFTKMTGVDVTSTRTAKLPNADGGEPDEFEAEFQDEVALPDATRAHREWEAMKHRLDGAPRIACGLDLGREFTGETFAMLDMESRWEACLRGRFYGTWSGSPALLERFPQPR